MKICKGSTPGPWKAHLNVPTAIIEGHIVKADHGSLRPIASLWVGGGTKGKPEQVANAHLIAKAPLLSECYEFIENLRLLAVNKQDAEVIAEIISDRCEKLLAKLED